jgi:hypothetical protein
MKGMAKAGQNSAKVSAASTAELHVVEGQACAPEAQGHLFLDGKQEAKLACMHVDVQASDRQNKSVMTDVIIDQHFDIIAPCGRISFIFLFKVN